MPRLIGIDLGTTTVTGVLLDVTAGEVCEQVQLSNDGAATHLPPSHAEQEPGRLLELAIDVLARLATCASTVDGIAVTGQMHGLLCAGRAGQPLTNLISWQDRRTSEANQTRASTLDSIVSKIDSLAPRPPVAEAWHENGCRIGHGYGAATWLWLAQHDQLPCDTYRICSLPSWISGQLAGRLPVTDPTLAASWGIFSLLDWDWNQAAISALGIDRRLLPVVLPSGHTLGGLDAAIGNEVGLQAGTPIHNALGDNQGAFLGSVDEPETTLLLNLGTGGQVCWLGPGFEPPSQRVETRPLPGRRFLRAGASLCAGAAYAWLMGTVRSWLEEFGLQVDERTAYERLNELAAAEDDSLGLSVRTTFLGERGTPDNKAGAIEGITLHNMKLGRLARATLVGIVDELYRLFVSQAAQRGRFRQIVAAGGTVLRNPLLPGLIEERFGLPVRSPRWEESAAAGAALLAARSGRSGAA